MLCLNFSSLSLATLQHFKGILAAVSGTMPPTTGGRTSPIDSEMSVYIFRLSRFVRMFDDFRFSKEDRK
jgi:hypothetical protein